MKKLIGLIALLITVARPLTAQTQLPIRVNCGGPSYTDSKKRFWQADTGFSGGTAESIRSAISGTTDPLLYEDFRSNPTSYSFPVRNGDYQVNLYFAEAAPKGESLGARVFNVSLQGEKIFLNLDIYAAAGPDVALIKSANVEVTGGKLTIGFTHVSGLNPKISAIEILPLQTAESPTLAVSFKYSDGMPVTGTLKYAISSALLSFEGSVPLINGQAECVLFANPSALGISAEFTVNLNLTDSAGHQLWKLILGVNPAQVNLGAIQSSSLDVVVQKP